MLRSDYKENVSIDEGIKFCMKIFKEVLGKNFETSRFEVGYILNSDEQIVRLEGEELKKFAK